MFDHDLPNAVVLGDSNTWAFGPAWVDALVELGWPREQILLSFRSGSKPRSWLPKSHDLYQDNYGVLLNRKVNKRGTSVHDALSPLTKLVIVGLGGNMLPGTRDDRSGSALMQIIERLAPFARVVWRGTPPSTATRAGKVASSKVRRGRYRKNGMLKRDLKSCGFELLGETTALAQRRIFVDILALHASGPAPRVRPLGTGRDVDFKAEQVLVGSLFHDKHAKGEVATRGPWDVFVKGRDGLPSHVPRGDISAALVEIVAKRGALRSSKKALKLPLKMRVVDPNALRRRGAPRYSVIKGSEPLPVDSLVLLERWVGRYAHVLDAESGEALGWTQRSNLVLAS